jgi:hypothetical protein
MTDTGILYNITHALALTINAYIYNNFEYGYLLNLYRYAFRSLTCDMTVVLESNFNKKYILNLKYIV